jgi:hypothetical protein
LRGWGLLCTSFMSLKYLKKCEVMWALCVCVCVCPCARGEGVKTVAFSVCNLFKTARGMPQCPIQLP